MLHTCHVTFRIKQFDQLSDCLQSQKVDFKFATFRLYPQNYISTLFSTFWLFLKVHNNYLKNWRTFWWFQPFVRPISDGRKMFMESTDKNNSNATKQCKKKKKESEKINGIFTTLWEFFNLIFLCRTDVIPSLCSLRQRWHDPISVSGKQPSCSEAQLWIQSMDTAVFGNITRDILSAEVNDLTFAFL